MEAIACEIAHLPVRDPRQDAIFYVEAIPSLGTGKTDLKRARQMAQSLMLAPTASAE